MNIDLAIQKTLIHEGGYTNNPADSGGPTKYGITQKDLPGEDIKSITQDVAVAYYKENYVKPLYSQIADQLLGEKIFDMGVLFGVKTAVKILQLAISGKISVVSDGVFGPTTLSDINQLDGRDLLQRYQTALINHTIQVVTANPQDSVFVHGWVTRINS